MMTQNTQPDSANNVAQRARSSLPMFVAIDGNDLKRDVASRDAAPVTGTYICDPLCYAPQYSGDEWHGDHCWHESTARRLEWQGGPSANADADLAAWNRLGSRRVRAA